VTNNKKNKKLPKIRFHRSNNNSNILLISPHGVLKPPYDDENTGRLALRLANNIGCHAVINRAFHRDDCDLNLVAHAEQVKEFIDSIKDVVDNNEFTYVFWIHGIHNDRITPIDPNAQCLIGYGQPKNGEESRYTARQEIIQKLIEKLKENEINALEAPKNSVYRGHDVNRMNQYFRNNGYTLEKVQSIQLEFKYDGIRHKESLDSAARSIGQAIKATTQEEVMTEVDTQEIEQIPVDKAVPAQDKEQVQPKNAAPAQVETDIPDAEVIASTEETKSNDTKSPETNVENNLPATVKKGRTPKTKAVTTEVIEPLTLEEEQTVETACIEIKRIFREEFKQATQNAMLSTGKYLIETFYNNEYEEVAKKEYTQNKSLAKLFTKLRQEKDGKIPQRTWLYNSLDLAIADKPYEDLKKALEEGKKLDEKQQRLLSSWTGHLTVSHKITLIQAKELNENQVHDLIIDMGDKPCKVLELRNRIAELKGETPKTSTPVEKLKSSVVKNFAQDKICKFNKEELKDLKKELNKILQTIKAEIDKDITATPPATATATEATA